MGTGLIRHNLNLLGFALVSGALVVGFQNCSGQSDLGPVPLTETKIEKSIDTKINQKAKVISIDQLTASAKAAQPGDVLQLKAGVYSDTGPMVIEAYGTLESPIVVQPEAGGDVTFDGDSRLTILGKHVVVFGFQFISGNSLAGENQAVVSIGHSSPPGCQSCYFVNNRISSDQPGASSKENSRDTDYRYLSIYGSNNFILYNEFSGKRNGGSTLTVWSKDASAGRHVIYRNLFVDNHGLDQQKEKSGYPQIQVGDEVSSRTSGYNLVAENVFEKIITNDTEVVSIRSGKNKVIRNSLLDSQGGIVLRYGNDSVVESNFIDGFNGARASGIRVMGLRHRVVNNHIQNLKGDGDASAALAISSGQRTVSGYPQPLNGYQASDSALIEQNTLVNVTRGVIVSRKGGGADPQDILVANNVLTQVQAVEGTYAGVESGNLLLSVHDFANSEGVLSRSSLDRGSTLSRGLLKPIHSLQAGFNKIDMAFMLSELYSADFESLEDKSKTTSVTPTSTPELPGPPPPPSRVPTAVNALLPEKAQKNSFKREGSYWKSPVKSLGFNSHSPLLEWTFENTLGENVQLSVRALAKSDSTDSVYVVLNGGSAQTLNLKIADTVQENIMRVKMRPGANTVAVYAREPNVFIEKIDLSPLAGPAEENTVTSDCAMPCVLSFKNSSKFSFEKHADGQSVSVTRKTMTYMKTTQKAVFEVSVAESAIYTLYLDVVAKDASSNSVFLRIDGSSPLPVDVPSDSSRRIHPIRKVRLNKGTHKIEIAGRESGARLFTLQLNK